MIPIAAIKLTIFHIFLNKLVDYSVKYLFIYNIGIYLMIKKSLKFNEILNKAFYFHENYSHFNIKKKMINYHYVKE